jgi:hypothetical protein
LKRKSDPALLDYIKTLPCIPCLEDGKKVIWKNKNYIKHLKPILIGGPDEAWNCLPVCLPCLMLLRDLGTYEVSKTNNALSIWLTNAGWSLDLNLQRWKHPNE